MDPFSILTNFLRKYRVSLPLYNPHEKIVPVLLLTFRKPAKEIGDYIRALLNTRIIHVRSLTEGLHGWIAVWWLLKAAILKRPFVIIIILNEPVKEFFFRSDLRKTFNSRLIYKTDFFELDRLTDQSFTSLKRAEYSAWIQRELQQGLKVSPGSITLRFNSYRECPSDLFKVFLITAPPTLQDIGWHLANIFNFNIPPPLDLTINEASVGNPSTDPFNLMVMPISRLNHVIDSYGYKKPEADEKDRLILKYGNFDDAETRHAIRNAAISIRSPFPNFLRREVLKNKFWYVDIPRTSSSSLKTELGRKFGVAYGKMRIIDSEPAGIHIFPNHVPASIMKSILGEATWNQIFTFSLTRNPWDRVLSLYHYRRRIGSIPEEMTFREYVLALEKSPGRGLFRYHGFYYGSADYICDNRNNILVSYWGKYEERRSVLESIGQKLGYTDLGKLHLQVGKGNAIHYYTQYKKDTREIVRRIYQRDIDHFKYEFEDAF